MTPSLACTGSSARWCPVCGDCACGPRYEGDGADGERTLDDDGCPLHGASSAHARDAAPDLAADHIALADALATAERELARLRAQVEYLAPRQRAGQLVANALHWLDATFYENARNTEIDPWERDDNVKEYLDHWRDALVVPWVKAAADARAEADALRATVEGRDTAPTPQEIDAHAAADTSDRGGQWRVVDADAGWDWLDAGELRQHLARCTFRGVTRYWPLDRDGRPCAWPTVTP